MEKSNNKNASQEHFNIVTYYFLLNSYYTLFTLMVILDLVGPVFFSYEIWKIVTPDLPKIVSNHLLEDNV